MTLDSLRWSEISCFWLSGKKRCLLHQRVRIIPYEPAISIDLFSQKQKQSKTESTQCISMHSFLCRVPKGGVFKGGG